MSKSLIVGNWKMGPEHAKSSLELFAGISKKAKAYNASIVIAPPSIYLGVISQKKRGNAMALASQNHAMTNEPAQTGEISAQMVSELGVSYTIVGHSERRAMGETAQIVSQKLKIALAYGLIPILCVGERVRDIGHKYLRELEEDVRVIFSGVSANSLKKIVIAYEPIWAVGSHSKREATPEECTEMIIFIKRVLSDMYGKKFSSPRFIYGGSVHPENAKDFLDRGNVTGLLVGRDSLNLKKFLKILEVAND